jgi:RimJ/RimL family protein N-acetyltransferase
VITGEHTYIRTTDPDDAPALYQAYDARRPRASLLDRMREPLMPTAGELREMLGRKEAEQNALYTVEDKTGAIRGFCTLRSGNQEACFGELVLVFLEESTFGEAVAGETLAYLRKQAFERMRLNKIVAHCLDSETELRAFLLRQGFESNGKLRDVFYGQGGYQDIEALSLYAPPEEDSTEAQE